MVPSVIGNLIGMQDDRFDIALRYRYAKSLGYAFLIGTKNGLPVCIASGNHTSLKATRPGDNSAIRIEAVFVVNPGGTCKVDLALSQRFGTPLISIVGLRIAGRRLQIVEVSNVRRFSRSSDGNRMGSRFSRAGTIRDRDGNGSFAGLDAVNLTSLVHGEDFRVAAFPGRGNNGRVIGGQHSLQLSLGERSHFGGTVDADCVKSSCRDGDLLGSGDPVAVGHRDSRGSGFQSRNDAGR